MTATIDHGWDEFGPTNETLHAIYRTLPFYEQPNKVIALFLTLLV